MVNLSDPVSLLIWLLVAVVVVYLIYFILGQMTLPAPTRTIVYLIIGVILLIWLLRILRVL